MSTSAGKRLSRRESIRRAALLAGAAGMPLSFTAASDAITKQPSAPWSLPRLNPVRAAGYGTDPDLLQPASIPWPTTLSDAQRQLLATLADILIPAEASTPAASAVGVVEVIDEWISAPYPAQQQHRLQITAGLAWCDNESVLRFGQSFGQAADAQRLAIIDDIAFGNQRRRSELTEPVRFFDLLRRLVSGAFYTSPEGVRELGYLGNVPIQGDYPGPSAEAMAHLNKQLAHLGLNR